MPPGFSMPTPPSARRSTAPADVTGRLSCSNTGVLSAKRQCRDDALLRTGRQKGPPRGSQNRLTYGLKTAAHKARRREVNAMLRAARQAIREAR
jgi:hypothetical protein